MSSLVLTGWLGLTISLLTLNRNMNHQYSSFTHWPPQSFGHGTLTLPASSGCFVGWYFLRSFMESKTRVVSPFFFLYRVYQYLTLSKQQHHTNQTSFIPTATAHSRFLSLFLDSCTRNFIIPKKIFVLFYCSLSQVLDHIEDAHSSFPCICLSQVLPSGLPLCRR